MYTIYRLDFLRVPYAITSDFQSEWKKGVRDGETHRLRSCNWKKLGRSNDSLSQWVRLYMGVILRACVHMMLRRHLAVILIQNGKMYEMHTYVSLSILGRITRDRLL
jgi:hypothetical protein